MFELEETLLMGDRTISVYYDGKYYRISMTGFPSVAEMPSSIGKDEAITQFIVIYSESFRYYPLTYLFN